jgi:hypothetical protein
MQKIDVERRIERLLDEIAAASCLAEATWLVAAAWDWMRELEPRARERLHERITDLMPEE